MGKDEERWLLLSHRRRCKPETTCESPPQSPSAQGNELPCGHPRGYSHWSSSNGQRWRNRGGLSAPRGRVVPSEEPCAQPTAQPPGPPALLALLARVRMEHATRQTQLAREDEGGCRAPPPQPSSPRGLFRQLPTALAPPPTSPLSHCPWCHLPHPPRASPSSSSPAPTRSPGRWENINLPTRGGGAFRASTSPDRPPDTPPASPSPCPGRCWPASQLPGSSLHVKQAGGRRSPAGPAPCARE